MSMRKNVSVLMVSSLLLTLASCGQDDKSHSGVSIDPICEDVNCLSTVNWKIQLPGRIFPDKSRVDINGTTVLNECVSKQKYMIDRSAEPQNLYLENYVIPKKGELKIKITDLGHCDSESSFVEENNANFEFVKTGMEREIVINL